MLDAVVVDADAFLRSAAAVVPVAPAAGAPPAMVMRVDSIPLDGVDAAAVAVVVVAADDMPSSPATACAVSFFGPSNVVVVAVAVSVFLLLPLS